MEPLQLNHSEPAHGEEPARQVVDPTVSRVKFEREVAQLRAAADFQRARGVLLLEASFPQVLLAFAPPSLVPRAIAFAVLLDFTNYDLEPPSLTFVDPLTKQPLRAEQLHTLLPRQVGPAQPAQMVRAPNGQLVPLQFQQEPQNLIQFHPPNNHPFLCLPGVREYHAHPAHTGDAWLLHRGQGEGTLGFLIDQLCTYGTEPLAQYNPQVNISFNATGNVQFSVTRMMFLQNSVPA